MSDIHKKNLSSKLMAMKFMKRQQERELNQKREQEQQRVITEAQWVIEYEGAEIEKPKLQVEYESSYMAFEYKATVGRRSFGNFNPEIEKKLDEAASPTREAQERPNVDEDDMRHFANKSGISASSVMTRPQSAQPAKKRRYPKEDDGSGPRTNKQSKVQEDADRWAFKKPE
ncbi:hypothetical protein BC936DRAFT_136971 [Jimgerdemannia flammicorona]|uniref:Uncharacterized protein n=2 Tax=Jimgerdemannia flammicorona TaxID=994334 RepID=A0A433QY14_9FUNG|nr:hypothetical protein BC936DRAFT_136971 [Jimgerdemannia flammicorona]RUS34587.1 hypothetical protein BC938DRAFT_479599 [Jimgerdemannia flammicorona]RUS34588.1 hypothetical protein BC938DRAFT_479599 [Jimgerdemannia flammicorona]